MCDTPDQTERANFSSIDRVLHEPARLQITALLYVLERADYTFVMNQTGLSWGNLSAHLSKLEEASYLHIEKSFKGKRPLTTLWLTDQGREAFKSYTKKMKALFADFPA
ncbi:MAG: ArsR family transcriptional regulator [Anaerolinea sp.]|nr:ArsR family transcriptional regulator [Anaerolinea sp.]